MSLPYLPTGPLKVALALAYFGPRFQRQGDEQRVMDSIPAEWRDELPADYNWAETWAALEFRHDPAHVQQMRTNLKRLPGLARDTREQLDVRVHGVLTAPNRACLPVEDMGLPQLAPFGVVGVEGGVLP
ncbi:hypothetical protein ACFY2W_20265 [Streptomyces sp. NPDC001262]|uniref:hypothetical protein n=1 Tax=unclassified Streptomyces TaxID=2593676 RepID=UPI00367ACF7D